MLSKGSLTHKSFLKESTVSFFLAFYQNSLRLSIVLRELLWLHSRFLTCSAFIIKFIKSL